MNIGRFSTITVLLILQCTVTKEERVRACSMHRGVMNLEYRCLGQKVGTKISAKVSLVLQRGSVVCYQLRHSIFGSVTYYVPIVCVLHKTWHF